MTNLDHSAIVLDRCEYTENNTFEAFCSKCPQHLRNINVYVKKTKTLAVQNKNNRKLLQQYKLNIQNLKNKMNKLISVNRKYKAIVQQSLNSKIDHLDNVNVNSKIFAKLLLSSAPKNSKYCDDEKWICQCLYFRSSAGYSFLRTSLCIHLPHPSTLQKSTKIKCLCPGINNDVLFKVNKHVLNLIEYEKQVIFHFDELVFKKI